MDVKNVLDKFTKSLDVDKTDYTVNDLVKHLKSACANKKCRKSGDGSATDVEKEKKPLSAYNIFIRERMEEYKVQDLAPKDKLRKAVEAWNEHKKTASTSVAAS